MSAVPAFEGALDVFFEAAGARSVDVPILQPAEPYLDTAGEALRRRIFLTRGDGGKSLCLRPDFTIPVALAHIQTGQGLPRRYAYRGLVFRQDRDGPAEFLQAGIEDLGTEDLAEADAASIADAAKALTACGIDLGALDAVIGDQALFEAFLRTLGLPAGWQRRLVRTFGSDALLREAMEALRRGGQAPASIDPDLVEIARARDIDQLAAEIADRMEEGGLPPNRGRSPLEVALRLIEKVEAAEARLDEALLERLTRFLAIDVPLDRASEALSSTGTALGAAKTLFEARLDALSKADVDLSALRYRAAFGRPLDYYTGMVFEMNAAGIGTLAGGGRYDRLVSYLGAHRPIPAVGFSLWLDRVARATASAGDRNRSSEKPDA